MSWPSNCPTGKIGYRTPQHAHLMNKQIKERRHRNVEVYRCQFCPKWHTGRSEVPETKLREFKSKKANLSMLPMDPDDY